MESAKDRNGTETVAAPPEPSVIPAQAGIQTRVNVQPQSLDSRLRGNDGFVLDSHLGGNDGFGLDSHLGGNDDLLENTTQ